MSMSDFERCLNDLQENAGMRAELETLDANPESWVRWAGVQGYQITREEAGRLADIRDEEISDDDLEKVAGGWCGNETTTG